MEKSKLEFKDILQYIPYGLQARLNDKGVFNLDLEYPNENANKVGTITSFNVYNINDIQETSGILTITKKYSFDFESLDELDIILRPMSDLKLFGDEIAKLYSGANKVIYKKGAVLNYLYYDCIFENGIEELVINESGESWYRSYFQNEKPTGRNISNQWEVYNFLISKLFDVNGLIKKKLAISMNDVEK